MEIIDTALRNNDPYGYTNYTGNLDNTKGLADTMNLNLTTPSDSILGVSKNTLSGLADAGTALGGLAQSYAGLQQLGLAKDAFSFNKDMKEKEFAMAQDAYDKNIARAKSIGEQMRAGGVN